MFAPIRPPPFRRGLGRRAQMHEAHDAFVFRQAQVLQYARIVGGPSGQPLGSETQSLGGLQQGETDRAGAEDLFDHGHLGVFVKVRDHGQDQGGKIEAISIFCQSRRVAARVQIQCPLHQKFPQPGSGCAFDEQDAPRGKAAMVGNPHGDFQDLFQLRRVRPGRTQQAGWGGATMVEVVESWHVR